MGINTGIVAAVFFGNYLYQISGQNMIIPLLLFVAIDLFIYLPLALWVIPKDGSTHKQVSTSTPREEKASTERKKIPRNFSSESKAKHYPINRALCRCKSLVLYLAMWVLVYGQMFYVSYLNTEIANNYEVSDAMVSFIHTLRSAGIVISTLIISFFPRGVNGRAIFLVCFIIQAISVIMIGPSKLLSIPQRLEITALGTLIKGLADGFCFPYMLPEIMDDLLSRDKDSYTSALIGDTAAGLQGLMIELGFVVSFFLGPLLCDAIGFRETADLSLGLFVLIIVLLFLFGGLLKRKPTKVTSN